ncbi:MAG: hypothetical protein HC915_11850 [Anaerolineae bacterium]|nr:hypothetical protein [Anaerolineae bacterium]
MKGFPVLAELLSKPNLFSPLHRNLKLPLAPFQQPEQLRFYPASAVLQAAQALQSALQTTVPDYISYRLGSQKAAQLEAELTQLIDLGQRAMAQGSRLRLLVQVEVLPQALPPNE